MPLDRRNGRKVCGRIIVLQSRHCCPIPSQEFPLDQLFPHLQRNSPNILLNCNKNTQDVFLASRSHTYFLNVLFEAVRVYWFLARALRAIVRPTSRLSLHPFLAALFTSVIVRTYLRGRIRSHRRNIAQRPVK